MTSNGAIHSVVDEVKRQIRHRPWRKLIAVALWKSIRKHKEKNKSSEEIRQCKLHGAALAKGSGIIILPLGIWFWHVYFELPKCIVYNIFLAQWNTFFMISFPFFQFLYQYSNLIFQPWTTSLKVHSVHTAKSEWDVVVLASKKLLKC